MPKGVYTRRPKPLLDRFVDKVMLAENGCWMWMGAKSKGYGTMGAGGAGGGTLRPHRVAYEWLVGPIPDGMQLDHLCRNRACVNPTHLEPVTNRENTLRGLIPKEICPRGHEKNGWRASASGFKIRYCKTCARRGMQKQRERLRARGLTSRRKPYVRPGYAEKMGINAR